MKFKFAYATLLKHRKRLQDLAMKGHAEALAELLEQKKKLEKLYDDSTEALNFRFKNEVSGANAEVLRSVDVFTKGQVFRIEEQKKIVKQHQQIVEEKHEVLRQAAIGFKMVDKLQEKQREKFREEKRKKETKIMDEVVSVRAKWREADS